MRKLKLEMTIDSGYAVVDKCIINVKACIVNLCADIDRYFRLKFHLHISDEKIEFNYLIKNEYPYLSNMSNEQFEKLLIIFKDIRDINAHPHLCRSVFIDDDIKDYLTYILEPDYPIEQNNKLTLYGQAYVLFFLSHKYNLFPFITSYFCFDNFVNFATFRGKELNDYQIRTQHVVQEICGIGKSIYTANIEKIEYIYTNDLFRKYLTKIIFGIEIICSNTKKSFNYTWSIAKILRNTGTFDYDEDVLDLIIDLRNCWLHGCNMYDNAIINNKSIILDYGFVFKSFNKIKRCLEKRHNNFISVINDLNDFATSCFSYYVLRLIEVSYKVLDNRLLTEEKIDSRIKNLINSFNRFDNVEKDYFELAGELIEPDDLLFYVNGGKFSDKLPRVTQCYRLRIIKMKSEDGFDIGNYHTNEKELVFAVISINEKYSNKINGKYLSEYTLINEEKYGNRISVFDAVI